MYTGLYNFSEKPFNLTPDPKFLYLTAQHREALASMIYGITERRGFISITGEVGTGKTTLVYALLNNLDHKIKTVFIYHTNTTFEQLLKTILLELDIPFENEDKISLLYKLNEFLIHKLTRSETLAVIIDEAQNLSKEVMEEIRMLSNLETSKSKLLQIVFVGQPELEAKINDRDLRQLKQRIGIRRQIKPLTMSECKKYIDHRLNLVGSRSSHIFTSDALYLICKQSRGIPRAINILCENAFLIGYSLSKKKITTAIVREVIHDMSGSLPQPDPDTEPPPLPFIRRRSLGLTLFLICCIGLVTLGMWHIRGFSETRPTPLPVDTAVVATAPDHRLIGKRPAEPDKAREARPALDSKRTAGNHTLIGHIVTVNDGDSIFRLAQEHYGASNESLADVILKANPQITNVNRIRTGQRIVIPSIEEESLIIKTNDNRYKIHVGTFNTLYHARQFYFEHDLLYRNIAIILRKVAQDEYWYRVEVGSFENKNECLQIIATLRRKGLLPFFS